MSSVTAAATLVGNPLYRVGDHHVGGLVVLAAVPAAAWLLRFRAQRGGRFAAPLVDGYRRLPLQYRVLAWLLVVSAVVHLGLLPKEEQPVLGVLFVLDAAALLLVTWRLLLGKPFRLWAALLLVGSILAYGVDVMADEPPDEVGLATKLVELAALAIVLRPPRDRRLRRLLASSATIGLVVLTGMAAWAGAFAAASRSSSGGEHGDVPQPGTLIRVGSEQARATPAERRAAARFYRTAVRGLQRYRDVRLAAAAGYHVKDIVGNDFHAGNDRYKHDGRIFDPQRPENLIYAATARGPVLLGAMYEMPKIGRPGPRIGGPLTEWHAHENVCMAVAPFALAGLVSPFGGCPIGAVAIAVTPEMIHLWMVPRGPRFGELDGKTRSAYLASLAR